MEPSITPPIIPEQQPAQPSVVSTPVVTPPQGVSSPIESLPPTLKPTYTTPAMTTMPSAPVRRLHFGIIFVIIAILLIAGAGLFFANKYDLLPFTLTKTAYTPETFFSSILAKSATINSAAYKASVSVKVDARDKGAMPFQVIVTNTAALREQYQNDSQRVQDISGIISMLRSNYGTRSYNLSIPSINKQVSATPVPYPSSLQKMLADMTKINSYYKNTKISDPVTKKEYTYQTTDGGKNFKLIATFETDTAVVTVSKSYGSISTTTIISGKTVTFTKDSSYYYYLSPEPPKPFLIQLGEAMSQLPSDFGISIDAGAQSNFSNSSNITDWLAQFNAEGAFGDLTYKLNAEARKKDSDYYVRVNNMPSLFGSFSTIKGKWIKISPNDATSTNGTYNQFSYFTDNLKTAEKGYKEQRQALADILKKTASIADQEKLITFKSTSKETVDGRSLTRYELEIRKEAILPFYQKLVAEINKNKTISSYNTLSDQGLVEYLQSDEFSKVFDYYNQNTKLIFWTDSQGYPAIIEQDMRIIPPDSAVQLKGKQVNVALKLTFNDINKSVNIDVPSGSTPLSEVITTLTSNQYGYDTSGEAKMKSNLSSLRAQAEIVYSTSKNSYGTKAFSVGTCKQTSGTIFGNADFFKIIQQATNNAPSTATCASQIVGGKVTSYAVSVPLSSDKTYSWCIDSTGASKQIKGAITKSSCQ